MTDDPSIIVKTNPILEALTTPPDGTATSGATPGNASADVSAAITGASAQAVAEHNRTAEQPKGKRGRPRKIPVAGLDIGPGQVLHGEDRPENPSAPLEAFDDATAETLVESILEGLNDIAAGIQGSAASRFYNGDKGMIEHAEKTARMSEGTFNRAKASGKILVKKYLAAQMQWAPEIAFGVAIGLWSAANVKQYKFMEREWKARKAQNGN